MNIIRIVDIKQEEVSVYSQLTEAQLRNRLEPEKGIFIVESLKVIQAAFECGLRPLSFLTEERYIEKEIANLFGQYNLDGDTPVYTAQREVLAGLTGYELTRGFLCAMRRPTLLGVDEICAGKRRIAVVDGVVNSTNTGAIFRAAAALGIEALLFTPTCCDPLNRRSVRVSMGCIFRIPWTFISFGHDPHHFDEIQKELNALGFKTVALALDEKALPIDAPELQRVERMAIVMGTEGDGLPKETVAMCDYIAMIPMQRGVDSLNVAAAAAVAFWQLRIR